MPSEYVQCLVCGKVTPTDKGICYHCNAPLPSQLNIPRGTVVCPNCLRVTPVDTGFCKHCKAPLPLDDLEVQREPPPLVYRGYGPPSRLRRETTAVASVRRPRFYRVGPV